MEDRLKYYRSLSIDDRIALPEDQFRDYLDLLVQESNRTFHKSLANMESMNCNM